MEIKVGDVLTYKNGNKLINYGFCDGVIQDQFNQLEIVKVERPINYETIYEAPKKLLDKAEKKYLENVLRPFKDRINFIRKEGKNFYYPTNEYISEYIYIDIGKDNYSTLPYFEKDQYYKGMEIEKDYTLDELGLFKE